MPAIGHVQRQDDGSFRGALKTLSVNAEIVILPNRGKTGDQPDYRILSSGVELGGGRVRTGEVSCREYIRLALSAPELGGRTLYANLGRAAGQDDDDAYAIIWNPGDLDEPPRPGHPARGFFLPFPRRSCIRQSV